MGAGGVELAELISQLSLRAVYLASALIAVLVLAAILVQFKQLGKQIVFWSLVAIILATTVFISTATIYLNQQSLTGGPVHWHADYQVWRCGQELELVSSRGFSNKVGTPIIHGHNDKRVHIEGVITEK
ncbi:MAG: hypothetical protein AAB499_01685, partial [Patescibacteria group bacterium]